MFFLQDPSSIPQYSVLTQPQERRLLENFHNWEHPKFHSCSRNVPVFRRYMRQQPSHKGTSQAQAFLLRKILTVPFVATALSKACSEMIRE